MYLRVEMSRKRSTAVVDKFIQDNNVESNVILESQQAAVNNNRIPERSDLKLTTIINNIASRLNEVKTSKMNESYTKQEMNENERNERTNNMNKKVRSKINKNNNNKNEEIKVKDEREENADSSSYDIEVESIADEKKEYGDNNKRDISSKSRITKKINSQNETSEDDQESSNSNSISAASEVNELNSNGGIPSETDSDGSSITTIDEYDRRQFRLKHQRYRTALSKDPKYRIIDGCLPRPQFNQPSPPTSPLGSVASSSSAPSYSSPDDSDESSNDESIVDHVILIDPEDSNSSSDGSSTNQCDPIPPQPSPTHSPAISSVESLLSQMSNSNTSVPSSSQSTAFSFQLQTTSVTRNRNNNKTRRTRKHKQTKHNNNMNMCWTRKKLSPEDLVPSQPKPTGIQSLDSLDEVEFTNYTKHMDSVFTSDLIGEFTEAEDFDHPFELSSSNVSNDKPSDLPSVKPSMKSSPEVGAPTAKSFTSSFPVLDPEESRTIGHCAPKSNSSIRLSTFNPNGLPVPKLNHQLQYCKSEKIDIQCFSEINQNLTNHRHCKKFYDAVRRVDSSAKGVWVNTDIPMESEYKPGGAGLVSFQAVAGRIKDRGYDDRGRFTYQVFDSGSDFHSVVFSIYTCNATQPGKNKDSPSSTTNTSSRTRNTRQYFAVFQTRSYQNHPTASGKVR